MGARNKHRMNPLCTCRKKGAWRSKRVAQAVLDRLNELPLDPMNLYSPTGVVRCEREPGVWHLTSSRGKQWKKGKLSRDLRVRRR